MIPGVFLFRMANGSYDLPTARIRRCSSSARQSPRRHRHHLLRRRPLIAALETWPRDGVPQNPEAWLLTAARRSFIDLVRHRQVAEASEAAIALHREESKDMTLSPDFPDAR